MAKAYGTLTIIDLLDTATYIYYAIDDKGTNASKEPSKDKKYIGIYSGPSLPGGQPAIPPKGTEWFKYIGDDGKPGEDGKPAPQVRAQYAPTEEGPWSDTFDRGTHKYVHFSYNGGLTYGPAIKIVGEDGAEAESYIIETNQEEVLKFILEKAGEGNKRNIQFSPNQLTFEVFKRTKGEKVKLTSFEYKVGMLDESGKLYPIGQDISISEGTVTFDILSYAEKIFDQESQENDFFAQRALVESNCAMKISLLKDGKEILVKPIICHFGTSADMAQFAVYANGITMAIQNTKLQFDSNGLHIKNGGFDISNKAGDRVMFADTEGNVTLKGHIEASSGIFNGTVNATDGVFSGVIKAKGGNFSETISVDGILTVGKSDPKIVIDGQTPGKVGIYSTNFFGEEKEGFYLNSEGRLTANDIILGNKAQVANMIQVGEGCYIYNPNAEGANKKFIVIKQGENNIFSLDNEGTLLLGSNQRYIELNSKNSSIQCNFQSGVKGWKIDDYKAEFNNIVARGTLESSVFAQGTVQTVGGILLVRPSTIIAKAEEKGENFVIYPETAQAGFETGDYCVIGQSNELFKVVQYSSGSTGSGSEKIEIQQVNKPGQKIANRLKPEQFVGKLMISHGHKKTDTYIDATGQTVTLDKHPIGIAINSSDLSSAAPPHAISVFKNIFDTSNGLTTYRKEAAIVLGEMNGEKEYGGLRGYGLYADNVYLKGSLVASKISDDGGYFSGINTTSKIMMPEGAGQFTYFPGKKLGEILIWAGAKENTPAEIRNAPFKVDTQGNLYAGSGFFNGTIISNAEITAAKIRTAVIEGWNLDPSGPAALSIIDTNKAINFQRSVDGPDGQKTYENLLSLESTGLNMTVPMAIGKTLIEPSGKATFAQAIMASDGKNTTVDSNKISFLQQKNSSVIKSVIKNDLGNGSVSETDRGLKFYMLSSNAEETEEDCILQLSRNTARINSDVYCASDIFINNLIEYRQVTDSSNKVIGYDLYIKE